MVTHPQQQALPPLLQRAKNLTEHARMPWSEAEALALSEAGINDAEIDELIGNCVSGGLDAILCTPEELRAFTRSVLVHQPARALAASAPSQAQRDILVVNMMHFGSLTKHQARAIVAFALDGAVIDEAEFRALAPSREATIQPDLNVGSGAAPDEEAADDTATMDRMSDLLTRTANALRGDPGPLRRWSWHDLPERAAAAIAAIDVMTRAARKLASAPDWNPINTAPVREVVVVFWIDREGEDRRDLDFWDEGVWSGWHDHAEHTEIIGGHGVPYTAPYTHWKRLGTPSRPCQSHQPDAKPPQRPDDFCADHRCKAMGGCVRKVAAEEKP